MQHMKRRQVFSLSSVAFLLMVAVAGLAQELPKGVTPEDLATNNKLFLELAKCWPSDAVQVALGRCRWHPQLRSAPLLL